MFTKKYRLVYKTNLNYTLEYKLIGKFYFLKNILLKPLKKFLLTQIKHFLVKIFDCFVFCLSLYK